MFLWLLLGLTVMACSQLSPEEKALKAAQKCYESLLDGNFDDFLDGRAYADNLPDAYRSQLLEAYKQFIHQQKQAHGGIDGLEPTRAKMDSTLGVMQAFLICRYADGVSEEIVVPMIEQDGHWKMK